MARVQGSCDAGIPSPRGPLAFGCCGAGFTLPVGAGQSACPSSWVGPGYNSPGSPGLVLAMVRLPPAAGSPCGCGRRKPSELCTWLSAPSCSRWGRLRRAVPTVECSVPHDQREGAGGKGTVPLEDGATGGPQGGQMTELPPIPHLLPGRPWTLSLLPRRLGR